MNKIVKYLNQHIVGNVFDKPSILEAYSEDRSILKITPRFVAIPYNLNDVRRLVKFSNQLAEKGYELPITVRGSGLDKTGADLGSGMVISMEKMNDILEIDERSRLVRVQAGATIEKIQTVLALHGLSLPISVNPKETIGGVIANLPSDPSSKKYDGISRYIDRIEVVLSTGDYIQTVNATLRGLNRAKGLSNYEGAIYRDVDNLLNDEFDTVEDVSEEPGESASRGYQMITKVFSARHKTFDLLPLFFGSQGTLGVITEVILKVEPAINRSTRVALGFSSVRPAINFLEDAAELDASSLDIYDSAIIRAAASTGKELSICEPLLGRGYYVIVSFNDSPMKNRRKLKKLLQDLPDSTNIAIETPDNRDEFEALSAALTSYLNDTEGERTPLVDDAYVPAEQLPNFLVGLKALAESYETQLPIYGSYAISTYTVRPEIDMTSVDGRQSAVQFIKDYYSLLKDYDGRIVAGGGEGRTKGMVTTRDLPENERELYEQVKKIFDPNNILNPEVKLGATRESVMKHLRTNNKTGIITD